MTRHPEPMTDETWEQRKERMRANTAEHVRRTKGKRPEQAPVRTVAIDMLACGPDCPECGGEGFTLDHTESAVECSRYRERLRKVGGDD